MAEGQGQTWLNRPGTEGVDPDVVGCIEHVWRFDGATLTDGVSLLAYSCSRCPATTVMQPWTRALHESQPEAYPGHYGIRPTQ